MRHNLDVMHVEKNVAESLISTMLHDSKSKDGINSRKDLEEWGIRQSLCAQPRGNRTYLPPAPYMLSLSQKKYFVKGYMILKVPMVISQISKYLYH